MKQERPNISQLRYCDTDTRLWSLRLLSFLFLTAVMPFTLSALEPLPVYLGHDVGKGEVTVNIRGEHFTTYHYGEGVRTPFLWPVNSEGGVGLTRNYPMGSDEPESGDHRHHRSLYLTFGDVNGFDHWHNESIDTTMIKTGLGDGFVWIRAHNEWLNADSEPLVAEVQELRFYDTPDEGRYFDLISTLKANYGEVRLGDNKEGLMAFRVRPEIQGDRSGVMTNAEGRQGEEEVYGTPSRWMDYSGPIAGHGVRGIALFDHPDNFRHPTFWHVRDYGLVAANPFGRSSVGGEDEDGSHILKEGESMTFAYRIYVHSGNAEEAEVAEHYDDFARESYFR